MEQKKTPTRQDYDEDIIISSRKFESVIILFIFVCLILFAFLIGLCIGQKLK